MKTTTKFLLLISMCSSLWCTALSADTIYKSVDEHGNVSYSTTPPKDNERSTAVDIAPPPSEKQVKAAQERGERNQEAADILDENRKKRDEITAEQNREKRENQKQLQQQRQAEQNNSNDDYGYPYYPRRRVGNQGSPVVSPRR